MTARESHGTAKVALIAIDRSIGAWAGLRESLGDDGDGILDLLAQLAGLRRETQELFPNACAFIRPGFDEPAKVKQKSTFSATQTKASRA